MTIEDIQNFNSGRNRQNGFSGNDFRKCKSQTDSEDNISDGSCGYYNFTLKNLWDKLTLAKNLESLIPNENPCAERSRKMKKGAEKLTISIE
ncbi:hypothetical protein TNIN_347991 [Trichonephila inaurata madagascariensis]|uniref:Uncharacterized protein n=1 Tax=Trichonephila inaurata madagascariensis TaxID=2747483 RepID=A0A8X6XYG8_9ARAC|nr:hypothetical protein TNIN_45211 [Trichonephila inaurata madagascariensis]GFY61689.1 hypothetical protein TNIN_347991 [Trichonephila inaurata madagascariensis]